MSSLAIIAIASAIFGKFYEFWRKNWQGKELQFDPRYIWEWLASGGLAWIITEALPFGVGLSVSSVIQAVVLGFGSGFGSHEILKTVGAYKE